MYELGRRAFMKFASTIVLDLASPSKKPEDPEIQLIGPELPIYSPSDLRQFNPGGKPLEVGENCNGWGLDGFSVSDGETLGVPGVVLVSDTVPDHVISYFPYEDAIKRFPYNPLIDLVTSGSLLSRVFLGPQAHINLSFPPTSRKIGKRKRNKMDPHGNYVGYQHTSPCCSARVTQGLYKGHALPGNGTHKGRLDGKIKKTRGIKCNAFYPTLNLNSTWSVTGG